MTNHFKIIGLMTRYQSDEIAQTLHELYGVLKNLGLDVIFEQQTATLMAKEHVTAVETSLLGQQVDLIISVGGDGSFLSAAHCAIDHDVPIVGVNRGRLGFLTDIQPQALEQQITRVLRGEFWLEERFLLNARVDGQLIGNALNDVVLKQGNISHMLEFDISINNKFMCRERADGLIIATPTGSTAYALSGGGPILHPGLDAIVLLPMFSHTLSSRPIVVTGESTLSITITEHNADGPTLRCDGQGEQTIAPKQSFQVNKFPKHLRLIHPQGYDYYQTLRSKLGWGRRL